jgi:inosine-uridine nucleoside N-ribohydrolase
MNDWPYTVRRERQVRVIVDTDAACEADDQFALAHALLTPKLDVRGVTAAHFGEIFGPSADGQAASFAEATRIVGLLGRDVPVLRGAPSAIPDETAPVDCDAARFIVEEALREDERPLYILNQGPLTNLASALLMEPSIAGRATAVWIGGGPYPDGGYEFNLGNDIAAANVVMRSEMWLWQIPVNVYSLMQVSIATLADKVAPHGAIGDYLFRKTVEVSQRIADMIARSPLPPAERAVVTPNEEVWNLGDSPAVGVLLSGHRYHYRDVPAPSIAPDGSYAAAGQRQAPEIRVYDFVDSQMILEDFYAKLRHAESGRHGR